MNSEVNKIIIQIGTVIRGKELLFSELKKIEELKLRLDEIQKLYEKKIELVIEKEKPLDKQFIDKVAKHETA